MPEMPREKARTTALGVRGFGQGRAEFSQGGRSLRFLRRSPRSRLLLDELARTLLRLLCSSPVYVFTMPDREDQYQQHSAMYLHRSRGNLRSECASRRRVLPFSCIPRETDRRAAPLSSSPKTMPAFSAGIHSACLPSKSGEGRGGLKGPN